MTTPATLLIDDTFAEAFPMKATRLIITAHRLEWARHAAVAATGFATSVIACGCEAGIERELPATETPDGRPGISLLLFAMSSKELAKQVERRVGQCVLTCPTTAVFAGLPEGAGEAVALGRNLRFFGDGWQIAKVINGVRYWRVPVMDGEFVAQESTFMVKGVGGGNLLLLARDTDAALAAAEAAVAAMRRLPDVILPFPGGVVRSGSKVGSRYPSLMASTNHLFCPSLYGMVADSELDEATGCVMEIVIDGLSESAVAMAMQAGLDAAQALGPARGLWRVSAGNYGGKLGPFHFHLHRLAEQITRGREASRSVPPVSAAVADTAPVADTPRQGWHLHLRQRPGLRLDARRLLPHTVAQCRGRDEVAALPLLHGGVPACVADWFEITPVAGVGAGDALTFSAEGGDLSQVDNLGRDMQGGWLHIQGTAGDAVGAGMVDGVLRVDGDAGCLVGCEMQGGTLEVRGCVGDFAAAAWPGSMDGMRGGVLWVNGSAGARLADRMRRGTVVVLGDVGDFAASRLVAGTVVLGGSCGAHPAYGMRRGTLVLAQSSAVVPARFTPATRPPMPTFWALLSRDLLRVGQGRTTPAWWAALPALVPSRFQGDRAVDGRGEWLSLDVDRPLNLDLTRT